MEEAQKFLQDRIGQLGLMLAVPGPARTVIHMKGSTPQEDIPTRGPLFKVGLDGVQMRDDSKIHYDKDLGYYGPGKLN